MHWGWQSNSIAALLVKTAQTGMTQPLRQSQVHAPLTHGLSRTQNLLTLAGCKTLSPNQKQPVARRSTIQVTCHGNITAHQLLDVASCTETRYTDATHELR